MITYEYLRKWQRSAYAKWILSNCNGIIVGCTGSGKSMVGMYCIQEKNVNTLIVVPTIALMNQWVDELGKNLELKDIGKLGDKNRMICPVTVAVINSIRESDLSYFDMIIMDEVHRYASLENIKPLLSNNFRYKIGLTATLKRSDGQHNKLEELIGPVVYEYMTKDAVGEGVLSKFEIINVGVELENLERVKYEKHTKTIEKNSFPGMFKAVYNQGHPKWHKAVSAVRATTYRKSIISNASAKMDALTAILRDNYGKKVVIFNETIKMAEKEKRELENEGYKVEIYHSKLKDQKAIEKFRSGEVNILISVKSLNEGLDVRDVDVGIRVAGTNQDRDTIQRLGRSLRVVEGKDCAKYYQIYCKNTVEQWQITKNTQTIRSASDKVSWV